MRYSILLVFALLFYGERLCAQQEQFINVLEGSRFGQDSTLYVEDDKFFDASGSHNALWDGDFIQNEAHNYLILEVNTRSKNLSSTPFSVSLEVTIDYLDEENQQASRSTSLKVNYTPGAGNPFQNRHIYEFRGGHVVTATITDFNLNGTTIPGLLDQVLLRSFIKVKRRYEMDGNARVSNLSKALLPHSNDFQISWPPVVGAHTYQLEWTFVDDYGSNNNLSNLRYDFGQNAQRVNLNNTSYRIPLVYEKGFLIFRVRPLGSTKGNLERPLYGRWDLAEKNLISYAVSRGNYFRISNSYRHEGDKKNWTYRAIYAENGKRSASTSYFDGMQMERQQVSRMNTEDYVLANQTIYDHQGRAAVKVLPAPVLETGGSYASSLQYYQKFNQNGQGEAYSRADFDKGADCSTNVQPMATSSGASLYYSPDNPEQSGAQQYLPDAGGFPFSQILYTPDNSGRIREESLPGPVHKAGSDHSTRYMYGTASSAELDPLFGNDVGEATYYRKRLQVDANGQVSVAFLDSQDNIIATALVGSAPQGIEALEQDQEMIAVDLLEGGNDPAGLLRQATYTLTNPTENLAYTFNYSFNPQDYSRQDCEQLNVCYDCVYDLQIEVRDDCGELLQQEIRRIGSLSELDDQCSAGESLDFSFSLNLSQGEHSITKKLLVNEEAADAYVADYLEQNACLEVLKDSIRDKHFARMDTTDCQVECTDCTDGLNGCEQGYQAMLNDVSPGGQYALFLNPNSEVEPSAHPFSLLNKNNLQNRLSPDELSWKNPDSYYRDEHGDTSWVAVRWVEEFETDPPANPSKVQNLPGGWAVKPQYLLKVEDFVDHWQPSWAESLVKYHPEYCYYEWCSDNGATRDFGSSLLETTTYANAQSKGLTDPLGISSGTVSDPFFVKNNHLLSDAREKFNHYYVDDSLDLSLPEVVVLTHHCANFNFSKQEVQQCVNSHALFSYPATKDKEWETFKNYYTALRNEFVTKNKHQYAMGCGHYNGCIGAEDFDAMEDNFLQDALGSFSQVTQVCFFSFFGQTINGPTIPTLKEKTKRFPDHDDAFSQLGIAEFEDPAKQIEEMERWADQKVHQSCGKCPLAADFENLLMDLALNKMLDQPHDLMSYQQPPALTRELAQQFSNPNAHSYNWEPSRSGNDLTIDITTAAGTVCNIQLHADSAINWQEIQQVSCLSYIEEARYFDQQGKRNFQFRAIGKDRAVYWIEGVSSCLEIGECEVPPYCEPTAEARDLKGIWNAYYFFMARQAGSPTRLPAMDVSSFMTDKLRQGHPSYRADEEPGSFNWEQLWFSSDSTEMKAALKYYNKPCNFDFKILTEGVTFQQPFYIKQIVLPHDSLAEGDCQLNELILQCRTVAPTVSNSRRSPYELANQAEAVDFEIYVTSDCYSFGDCCPEEKANTCPSLSTNGDFTGGYAHIAGDLTRGELPLQPGEFIVGKPDFRKKRRPDLKRPDPRKKTLSRPDKTTPGDPGKEKAKANPKELKINPATAFQAKPASANKAGAGQEKQQVNPSFPITAADLRQVELPSQPFQFQPAPDTDKSFGFRPGGKPVVVWKQQTGLNAGETYHLSFNVRADGKSNQNKKLVKLFSIRYEGEPIPLQQIPSPQKAGWAQLNGSIQLDNTQNGWLEITFKPEGLNIPDHNWWLDDIEVQSSSCGASVCCPPLPMPEAPYDNPCVAGKVVIAKENAAREIQDTIAKIKADIRQQYIAKCLNATEQFEVEYRNNMYHYSLAYYDQSGLLIKTIPPKGVKKLSGSQLSQVRQHRENGTGSPVYPSHELASTYEYTSSNQIATRHSPDGGQYTYWYDVLNRVVVSQSAEQQNRSRQGRHVYTYVVHDQLNRIIENGEILSPTLIRNSVSKDRSAFQAWVSRGQKAEIIRTYYDEPLSPSISNFFSEGQQFLRNAVASITYDETDAGESDVDKEYDNAIHYSYDPHGNVDMMMQEISELKGTGHARKTVEYAYDLVSGNINEVWVQRGQEDQFAHRYTFDSDNRIQSVETTTDGIIWEEDARYDYYKHGPLARTGLGDDRVQGIDHAYTIQGWVKAINSTGLDPARDIGKDGLANSSRQYVAQDVFAQTLGFYTNDFTPVGGTSAPMEADKTGSALLSNSNESFSGNISHSTIALAALDDGFKVSGRAFTYDQLQRLKKASFFNNFNTNTNSWMSGGEDTELQSTYAYDANGNITSLSRNGHTNFGPAAMDQLEYHYDQQSNQLLYVDDAVSGDNYADDLDEQSPDNYRYDANGRMTRDLANGITSIEWNNLNKVKRVVKNDGLVIEFLYGPKGKRIGKKYSGKNSWYFRDAQGRTAATYSSDTTGYSLESWIIHGLEQVGSYRAREENPSSLPFNRPSIGEENLPNGNGISTGNRPQNIRPKQGEGEATFLTHKGAKRYEIKDYNGSVATVISDKKLMAFDSSGAWIDSIYLADIHSYSSYYPYGMLVGGLSDMDYPYGFSGEEQDPLMKGNGNSYDYGARMYDPRLGRWMSVDAYASEFYYLSPYHTSKNNPVLYIDEGGNLPHNQSYGSGSPPCDIMCRNENFHEQMALKKQISQQKTKAEREKYAKRYNDKHVSGVDMAIYKTLESTWGNPEELGSLTVKERGKRIGQMEWTLVGLKTAKVAGEVAQIGLLVAAGPGIVVTAKNATSLTQSLLVTAEATGYMLEVGLTAADIGMKLSGKEASNDLKVIQIGHSSWGSLGDLYSGSKNERALAAVNLVHQYLSGSEMASEAENKLKENLSKEEFSKMKEVRKKNREK